MRTLLIVENVASPTSRVVKQLRSATERGWSAKVVVRGPVDPRSRRASDTWETVVLPSDFAHVLDSHRRERIAELGQHLAETQKELSEQLELLQNRPSVQPDDTSRPELQALHERVDELKASAQRTALQKRVLHEATRTPSPYGRPFPFGDPLRLEEHWYELAAHLASLDWDVGQAADLDTLPPLVWAAQSSGGARGVVYDAHEIYPELAHLPEVHRPAWREIARTFIPHTAAVMATSDAMAAQMVQRYSTQQPTVIKNHPSVDDRAVRDVRQQAGLPPSASVAVHIGGLRENRNPARLVEVLEAVPELHLVCLGVSMDAAGTSQVRALAEQCGVAARLHLLPPVDHELIVAAVQVADVSLITYGPDDTNLELMLPNKLFESVAAGVPVVAVDGTAAAWHVQSHGIGATFPPDAPGEIAPTVRRVLTEPSFRQRAKECAAAHTWKAVEADYLRVLDGVVASLQPGIDNRSQANGDAGHDSSDEKGATT